MTHPPRPIRRLARSAVLSLSLGLATLMVLMPNHADLANAASAKRAHHFKLDNGLEIVVVPDRRAPVVTHMVWYRVGAADEPPGKSGIAHFLEHLMFKGTEKVAPGDFSKIIARNGGQDNAFTTQDTTSYFQRVAKDRLPLVMRMEADRMHNLRLAEKDVLTEREVILEERRSRVENNPTSIMNEMMLASLYLAHPYRIPVIGWEHEIAKLSPEDAISFYKRYYAPNNAILVVAGDVEPDEVLKLAKENFGAFKPNPELNAKRARPGEPGHRVARRIEYKDPRAGKPTLERMYLAPSYATAEPGEAEALDLLMKVVAAGSTSRIYKKLVVESKVASSAGGYYTGSGLDWGRISLYAIAADGKQLSESESLIDAVLAEVRDKGVTDEELERGKKVYIAEHIQESDSQSALARRYGWAMTTGQTIKDVEEWPDRIAKVTTADLQKVAAKYLDIRRSVTGHLLPGDGEKSAGGKGAAKPDKS